MSERFKYFLPSFRLLFSLLLVLSTLISIQAEKVVSASFIKKKSNNLFSQKNLGRQPLKRKDRWVAQRKTTTKTKRITQQQTTESSFKTIYDWYLKSCTENPLMTKGVTAGLIAALGDYIAQTLDFQRMSNGDKNAMFVLNIPRVMTFFACNAIFTGPYIHYWYQTVFKIGNQLQKQYHLSKWKQLVCQVLIDQSIGVIIFFPLYIFIYDILEKIIQYHQLPSLQQATGKCLKHLPEVILMQYRLFPLSNTINFAFIPDQLRVLFSNIVSLFWNIYLCSIMT